MTIEEIARADELRKRCRRIQQIDEQIHALFSERFALQWHGLTTDEVNRLTAMVRQDHKPHYF